MVEAFTFQTIKTNFDKPMNVIRWKILAGVFFVIVLILVALLIREDFPGQSESSARLPYTGNLRNSNSLELTENLTYRTDTELQNLEIESISNIKDTTELNLNVKNEETFSYQDLNGQTGFRVSNKTPEKVPLNLYNSPHQFGTIGNQSHIVTRLPQYVKNNCTRVLHGTNFNSSKIKPQNHGFIHTVISAYNGHHNLIIRPDDIWIAIATQFSFYVNANTDKFRGKFVNFTEEQKELNIDMTEFGNIYTAPQDVFIKRMTEEIHKNLVDDEVKNWIFPNFTTTTTDDYVTCGVLLMATLKKYFIYKENFACGIPYIYVEGSVEDWQQIQKKVQKLREYELGKWVDMLNPILEKFIEAKQGNVNKEFWQDICHFQRDYVSTSLTGWLSSFAVFDANGEWQGGTPTKGQWPELDIKHIPTGVVEVEVIIDDHGADYRAVILAGHLGTEALPDGYTLQPRSGWAMAMKAGHDNPDSISPVDTIGLFEEGVCFNNA